jgi:hypothetical protein
MLWILEYDCLFCVNIVNILFCLIFRIVSAIILQLRPDPIAIRLSIGAAGSAFVENGSSTWDPPPENTPELPHSLKNNIFVLTISAKPIFQMIALPWSSRRRYSSRRSSGSLCSSSSEESVELAQEHWSFDGSSGVLKLNVSAISFDP